MHEFFKIVIDIYLYLSVEHIKWFKHFFFISDTPDAPTDLAIDSYDKRTCNLSWKKPAHDGGNPVKGLCALH